MTSYIAMDGSTVDIPPVRPLPCAAAGPVDHIDLAPLLEARSGELARLGPSPLEAMGQGAPSGLPGFMAPFLAKMDKEVERQRQEAEALVDQSLYRFGADGSGFLKDFVAGRLDADFWQAERVLTARRRVITEYHAPKCQAVVRDLLATLPPARQIPILAQLFLPDPKHRASDKIHDLIDLYLTQPHADLRHWETGHEPVGSMADLPLKTQQELAVAISVRVDALRSLTKMAMGGVGAVLTGGGVKDMLARGKGRLTAEEAEVLMSGPPPAKSFGSGTVQSELNFHKFSGWQGVMRGRVPGRPKGTCLVEALMAWPPGDWRRFRFDAFSDRFVWPYLAEHLPMFDRALGLVDPLPFEPAFQRLKALKLLARLPKTPARYGDVLRDLARKRDAQGKAARALLA